MDREGKIRHALFGEIDVTGWSEQDLRETLAKQHGSQVVIKRTTPVR